MTGARLTLDIEKPTAGGRMLARHQGRIVFVAGAIPGERVVARVERTKGDVVFAKVEDVLAASPHRRPANPDPLCGGMTFSHIADEAQRALKAEMVTDAFARIGKMRIAIGTVHASPGIAYRMRARVHVRGGRLGSFREGSHDVCDVAITGQVRDDTVAVLRGIEAACEMARVPRVEAIEIAENLDATERVLHIEPAAGASVPDTWLEAVGRIGGVAGVTLARAGRSPAVVRGASRVGDPLSSFVPGRESVRLERQACSFFQANRFLTPGLAQAVIARIDQPRVIDLYAGVGLFALGCASAHDVEVTAVEGDPSSADDLARNARALTRRVRVVHAAVEDFAAGVTSGDATAVIVDPPRTGMSTVALDAIVRLKAPTLIYVSCDVPTAARDAKRLVESGYRLASADVFDMFPNTPHVESLVTFTRG